MIGLIIAALAASGVQATAEPTPPADPAPKLTTLVRLDAQGKPDWCAVSPELPHKEADKAYCAKIMGPRPIRVLLSPMKGGIINADGDSGSGAHLLNTAEVFSSSSYPAEAMRAGAQGRTIVKVTVDPAGRPVSCVIIQSSGALSLDKASCARPMALGKFTPASAKDLLGPRVSVLPVNWVLPPPPPMAYADVHTDLRWDVQPDGQILHCRAVGSLRADALPPPSGDHGCKGAERMAASAIAYFKAVLPLTPFTLVLSNGQLIGGPEGANAIGRGPGQQLLAATVAAVEVDAAGTVASCAAIELEVGPLPGPGLCDDVKKAIFLPLPKEAEDRSARHAVEYVALIAMPPERAR